MFHSFPHARGGVPISDVLKNVFIHVFPTHVGVYLCFIYMVLPRVSFPHARGGVPKNGSGPSMKLRFPHARGGVPVAPTLCQPQSNVFPTHVGVYLSFEILRKRLLRFPHARGGVPPGQSTRRPNAEVFPTHVGVPIRRVYHRATGCFPTRGSVPELSSYSGGCTCFPHVGWPSPMIRAAFRRGFSHAWGVPLKFTDLFMGVFPTHVGTTEGASSPSPAGVSPRVRWLATAQVESPRSNNCFPTRGVCVHAWADRVREFPH